MLFEDRVDAGKKLSKKLIKFKSGNLIILALPRGGVPIGFQIAKNLHAPLDVLVVRKLGAPSNPEFGIGAIADGVRILDEIAVKNLKLSPQDINNIEIKERAELNRRIKEYRGTDVPVDVKGKTVILVDDGLATGVTARAAIQTILQKKPQKLIVAMPVCALDSVEGIRSLLRPMKDQIICLSTPYDFSAVGLWYKTFGQVSDLQVIDLLKQSQKFAKKGRSRTKAKSATSKSTTIPTANPIAS